MSHRDELREFLDMVRDQKKKNKKKNKKKRRLTAEEEFLKMIGEQARGAMSDAIAHRNSVKHRAVAHRTEARDYFEDPEELATTTFEELVHEPSKHTHQAKQEFKEDDESEKLKKRELPDGWKNLGDK